MGPSGECACKRNVGGQRTTHLLRKYTAAQQHSHSLTMMRQSCVHLMMHTVGVLCKDETILACICWADDLLARPAESEVLLPCL